MTLSPVAQPPATPPPSGATTVSLPADFELEFYKLHRAHEVALNNATAAYEQSLLRFVTILNAASIGGLVGLLQASGKESGVAFAFDIALVAIIVWCGGITSAFISMYSGYACQRIFAQAYLARRRAVEAKRATEEEATLIGIERNPKKYYAEANLKVQQASRFQKSSITHGYVAVVLALIGFICAIAAIRERTPSPELKVMLHAPIICG